MKRALFFATMMLSVILLAAQNSITVTFTCRTTDSLYVPPDHIKIENLDREWVETLHFPDTVYHLLVGTGIPEYPEELGLVVSPNPFDGMTIVTCDLPAAGEVTVDVTDLTGRVIVSKHDKVPQPDRYAFQITLSRPGVYLTSLRQYGETATTKLVNTGCGAGNAVEIDGATKGYRGTVQGKSAPKGSSTHPFEIGDQMRYVAYASNNASHDTVQLQYESDTLTLVFDPFPELGDSLPCPGTPTVTDYDGNIYNTVKIGNQCWMKDNLRTSHYADGTEVPLGDELASFTEPFYYNHPVGSLTFAERGYLYNWTALMNGDSSSIANPSGVQGVCPDGWHVPSIMEWTQLTDYVESQSEYTCSNGYGAYNGKALAAQTSWPESPYSCAVGHYPYTNNATGFSAFSAGYCLGSTFDNAGAFFWSSTYFGTAPSAYSLSYHSLMLNYVPLGEQLGLSVRCLRD